MAWDRQISIKSAAELSVMRTAGRINAEALAAAFSIVRPGATTADLNAAAEEVLTKYQVYSPFKNYPGPFPYPASTCVSVNEELVHGIPSPKRKLVEGDIVSVDCGTVFEGFVGDSAFTAAVGEISAAARKIMEITRQALQVAIGQMVPGKRTGDIGHAIQTFVEANGMNVTREYTSHGIGRRMHEGPSVPIFGSARTGMELRSGMTIALEPMVLAGKYETRVKADRWTVAARDGQLTAHFEHTVAVTENGPMVLTYLEDGTVPWENTGQLSKVSI